MTRRTQLLFGGLLILLGLLWLLDTADVLDVWRWGIVGPLLLIAFGLWRIATSFGRVQGEEVHGSVDTVVVLGERRLHCDGPFEGGSIASVLADVDLDLRHATLAASSVELSATTILADLDIVVPAAWRVRVEGPVILADVKVPDDVARPGRATGAAPDDRPELVIRAFALLGDLTVRRK